RVMPWLRSVVVPTEPSTGVSKLGQPVPLSNLPPERNSSCPQPAQRKAPWRFSASSAQLPGGSVPCARITRYCSGVSFCRHSASLRRKEKDWSIGTSCVEPEIGHPAGGFNLARHQCSGVLVHPQGPVVERGDRRAVCDGDDARTGQPFLDQPVHHLLANRIK